MLDFVGKSLIHYNEDQLFALVIIKGGKYLACLSLDSHLPLKEDTANQSSHSFMVIAIWQQSFCLPSTAHSHC